MLTLQAVGVGTAFYDGDSAVQSEVQAEDDEGVGDEYHNDDAVASCSDNGAIMLEESGSPSSNNNSSSPVLFFYDCEATGGSIYQDHIIEVASLVIESDDASVSVKSFSSLCRSSRHICKIG